MDDLQTMANGDGNEVSMANGQVGNEVSMANGQVGNEVSMANGHQDGVSVHAGFPNPALDHRGQGPRLALDINQLLVRHPSSTYLFRISGHRWSDQGVYDGDVAVIDRSTRRGPNDLVVIWDDAGFGLQRHPGTDETVWGVVTAIIHQFDRGVPQ